MLQNFVGFVDFCDQFFQNIICIIIHHRHSPLSFLFRVSGKSFLFEKALNASSKTPVYKAFSNKMSIFDKERDSGGFIVPVNCAIVKVDRQELNMSAGNTV